jgi:hypothetical protein
VWWLPAVLMIAISVAYYRMGKNVQTATVRFLTSAHGLIAAVLYIGALLLWELRLSRLEFAIPFLALYLLPLASIIYSFVRFSGSKLVHLLQLPNLALMFYTSFVGGMAVTGDWL